MIATGIIALAALVLQGASAAASFAAGEYAEIQDMVSVREEGLQPAFLGMEEEKASAPAFITIPGDLAALKQPAEKQGTVVTLEYDTVSYAVQAFFGEAPTVHKALDVYVPYGYDPSRSYNVLYLLHGTMSPEEHAPEKFWLEGAAGQITCNVLDNMIAQGLCEPLLVVTPNYYSVVPGFFFTWDELYQLDDILEYNQFSDPVEDMWPVYFGKELRQDIIPLVETRFSTYAGGEITEESLTASRGHRALAGLSRGAMLVSYAGLIDSTDIIGYYGSYSGVWCDFDTMENALRSYWKKGQEVLFWYNGDGTEDFALPWHDSYDERVRERMGDLFSDSNYAYVVMEGGSHSYGSWIADLYNSLLVFFR